MRETNKQDLENRRIIATVFILLFFVILAYGFARLQVIKKDFYTQKSLDNSVRRVTTLPVRGLIKDSKDRILVDNNASFTVAVIPKVVSDSVLIKVAKLLDTDLQKIRETIRKEYGFRPVKIAHDVPYETIIYLEENRLSYPGIITSLEPKRFYREGVYSPHIFGSLGEVTPEEQSKNPQYDQGDIVGKTALEKKYDSDLRGSKGAEYVRVDASGRELGYFNVDRNVEPVHGSDLHLYFDYGLQQFAESLMVDYQGSLVALDTRNGGVIALVSKPDYDPRLLTGKIDPDEWNQLLTDETHPLYSRSIQSVYPPGSTYKIVAAIAALEENIIDPSWSIYCPGYFQLGRRTIHCWNVKGHGKVDLNGAIRGSCNVYFYQLGLKIGLDVWSKYSKMLAFGETTGIDLPNESKGLVPTESFFNKRYGKNGWTKGNLANLAIGQGELLVTPLQLAQFAMILANKGVYYKPHLLNYLYNHTTESRTYYPTDTRYVTGISDANYDIVREAMRSVVEGGTGWAGKVPGIEMAGKTGTAQNPHGDSHAWFMAFAPFDLPEIAISVIVENGGGGSVVAAPIARKFMEKYFYNKLIPRPVAKKTTPAHADSVAPINLENIFPIDINRNDN
ncbi:MAG: penicillin-binding protein 2 [Calditrichaeota bacterium]|nr:penicillin-binding protein 2 [Calditrichota bacterium]